MSDREHHQPNDAQLDDRQPNDPHPNPSPSAEGEGISGDEGLEETLRHHGYDIESQQPGEAPGSIIARRDREDRVVLLAVDASGRFRAEVSWIVGEWPSRDVIGGVAVRVVDAVSRAVTITGQVTEPGEMIEFIVALETALPWAGPAPPEPARGEDEPGRRSQSSNPS